MEHDDNASGGEGGRVKVDGENVGCCVFEDSGDGCWVLSVSELVRYALAEGAVFGQWRRHRDLGGCDEHIQYSCSKFATWSTRKQSK